MAQHCADFLGRFHRNHHHDHHNESPNLEDADGSGTLQMAELLHGLLKIRGIGGFTFPQNLAGNDSTWVGFLESNHSRGWVGERQMKLKMMNTFCVQAGMNRCTLYLELCIFKIYVVNMSNRITHQHTKKTYGWLAEEKSLLISMLFAALVGCMGPMQFGTMTITSWIPKKQTQKYTRISSGVYSCLEKWFKI